MRLHSLEILFSSAEEGKSRKRNADEFGNDAGLLDRGYIVVERYQKKQAVFADFNTLKYRCMATFGAQTESTFVETNKVLNSIFASASMLATQYWRRQGRVPMEGDEFKKHLEEMHRHEGIFWDVGTENDEVRQRLSSIQKTLEAVMAPCFKEPMKLYGFLATPWWKTANSALRRTPKAGAAEDEG